MKIVIPGGSGQVGRVLARRFRERGHQVVILARSGAGEGVVAWDGKSTGAWTRELEGVDVVVNLAGRSVNCRYTGANLKEMMDSRIDSTRAIARAIEDASVPPRIWLQMSTATIYSHRFDAPNDEATGVIGGGEPDAPEYWSYSIQIATEWERAQADAATPATRKVTLRSAMVMSPDRGGIFHMLHTLVRAGLGGAIAGGRQFVSWIHHRDFVRAVEWIIARDDIDGPINLASPHPLPQKDFMRVLRDAAKVRIGLPATAWMVELGAFFLRTDTELILKSRRVMPRRLLDAGFTFEHPEWSDAARDLIHDSSRILTIN